MKPTLFAAIAVFGTQALACPNLSGDYSKSLWAPSVQITHVMQTGCDKLALGMKIIQNGQVQSDVEDAVDYLNRSLCTGSDCRSFTASNDALTVNDSGVVDIGPVGSALSYTCMYDSTAYSLTPDHELKLTHQLHVSSPTDPCARVGTVVESLPRVTQP